MLSELKSKTCYDMLTVVKNVDQDLLKSAIAGEKFAELFYANSTDDQMNAYLRSL